MGIVGHKNAFFFVGIFLFQSFQELQDPRPVFLKGISQICQDQVVGQMKFFTGIHEAADTAGGRSGIRQIRVHMDQDAAAAFLQQAGGLDAPQIVICIYTADILILPLNAHHGNAAGGQLARGDGGT